MAGRYREVQEQGSYYADFFEGSALFELERYDEAAQRFVRVLELEPEARNSRWRLAECYAELGRDADAAREYATFAERFPDDDRAKRAERLSRRLR
jgi:TolA-binding protein